MKKKSIAQNNLEFIERRTLEAILTSSEPSKFKLNIFNEDYTDFNENYLSLYHPKKIEKCLNAWHTIIGKKNYLIKKNVASLITYRVKKFDDIFIEWEKGKNSNRYHVNLDNFQEVQVLKQLKQAINIYKAFVECDMVLENTGVEAINKALKCISNHFKVDLGTFEKYDYNEKTLLRVILKKIIRKER